MSSNISNHGGVLNPRIPSFRTLIRRYSIGACILLAASEETMLCLLYWFYHTLSMLTFMEGAIAMPIIDILVIRIVVACIAEPLAIYLYAQVLQKSWQPEYTQLLAPIGPEEIPINCNDVPTDSQLDSIPAIIQRQLKSMLIVSSLGGGRTSGLLATPYSIVQHPWKLIWGSSPIPIYILMSDYNDFLKKHDPQLDANSANAPIQGTLLDYLLYANDMPGIHYLRPYLHQWAKQGRLLFLCDDIHTIDKPLLGLVCAHLQYIIEKEQNQVVMSSRILAYQALPQLRQLAADSKVVGISILPLHSTQLHDFVEQHIDAGTSDQPWRYTTDEMMQLIEQLHMDDQCLTPGVLLILMRTLNQSEGTDQDTCSRLQYEFLSQLIQTELEKPKWQEGVFGN